MNIGVLKEIKANENRVSMTPAGVHDLVLHGHQVYVQEKAGEGSGLSHEEYIQAGAEIIATPEEIVEKADMIVKVKEPLPQEYDLFKDRKSVV